MIRSNVAYLPWWAGLLLAILASQGEAASPSNCDGMASWRESELCRSPWLAEDELKIDNLYRKALVAAPDKDVLRNEQQHWLESRDACRDDLCLNAAYRERTADLVERLARSVEVTGSELTVEESRRVCQNLAAMASDGTLEHLAVPAAVDSIFFDRKRRWWDVTKQEKESLKAKFLEAREIYLLRLVPGAEPVRFASFNTGGTCRSSEIMNIHEAANSEDLGRSDKEETDDTLSGVHWAAEEYPIVYDKRTYLVAADISDPNIINMVSWIRPEGFVQPLCRLERGSLRVEVASAKEPELCARIADGRLAPLGWKDETEALRAAEPKTFFEKRYGTPVDKVLVLSVDLDGDGTTDNIGRLDYDRPGGCGWADNHLASLTPDHMRLLPGPLETTLGKLRQGTAQSMNLYADGGRYYVRADHDGRNDGVYRLDKGRTEEVCTLKPLTQQKVTGVYWEQ